MNNTTPCQTSALALATGSAPSAAAVAKLARRTADLARRFSDADRALKHAMWLRYGWHDEMPDSLVESINYGHGRTPTGREIDEQMTKAGFPPLPNTK